MRVLRIAKVMDAEGKPTGEVSYWMWCPGCNDAVRINNTWEFDGNEEKPTFSPSILKSGHWTGTPENKVWSPQCHSFVKNGQWEFLSDCDHALAGKTVPMVELPDWLT